MIALSTLPVFFVLLLYPLLPESARWLFVAGKKEEGVEQLRSVARSNRKAFVEGEIDAYVEPSRGNLLQLFVPSLRKTSILLLIIWFTNTFLYYGVVLLATELVSQNQDTPKCIGDQIGFTTQDYLEIFISTTGEFPGLIVAALATQKIGRKKLIWMGFLLLTVTIFLLPIPVRREIQTMFLFFVRGIITGVFQITLLYTPEVFPTSLRSTGTGLCSAISRIGGMLTPTVAVLLSKISIIFAISVYGIFSLFSALCSFFLPYETKGKPLPDVVLERKSDLSRTLELQETTVQTS